MVMVTVVGEGILYINMFLINYRYLLIGQFLEFLNIKATLKSYSYLVVSILSIKN